MTMNDVIYKIIARDPSTPAGYDGYAMFLVRNLTHSTAEKTYDSYLLTRETFDKGQEISVETGVEFLDVNPELMQDTRHGLRVFVYRPESRMGANVIIKSEMQLHKYTSLQDHRAFLAERQCSGGYPATLITVFSKVAYQKHEAIPANELVTTYGNPRYGSRIPYYVHDQTLYQNRLWDSIKAFCR